MNIFGKINIKRQLIKYIKNDSPNLFLNTLSGLNKNDIIDLLKDKELLNYFNKTSINHTKYLYTDFSENDKEIEKIDSLLVKSKLKNIKECRNNNLELWKEYLENNPNEILNYSGALDEDLRKLAYKVIDNNPNLILNSKVTEDKVISYAYSKYKFDIPITDSYKDDKVLENDLLNNKYYLKQYLSNNQNELINNKTFNDFLSKDFNINSKKFNDFLEKWNYILNDNSINEEYIKNIFSEEKYKSIYNNYFESSSFFKSKLFEILSKNYKYDGPIFISDISNKEIADIISAIYNTNKEMIKNIPPSTYDEYDNDNNITFNSINNNNYHWQNLFEKMNSSNNFIDLFNTVALNSSDKKKEIVIYFLKNMGYRLTKEDVIAYPKLYKYADNINFTKEDFIKNKSLRDTYSLVIDSLKKGIDVTVLDYINSDIFDSINVINLAKEKGYVFSSNNVDRFNYKNTELLKSIIDNKDFKFLYDINYRNLIESEIYEYALQNGFSIKYEDLLGDKEYFRNNKAIMMNIIKTQNKDAIYLLRKDLIKKHGKDFFKEILNDEHLKNEYTAKEINYFKLIIKNPDVVDNLYVYKEINSDGNISYIHKDILNKYFTETGFTKELFRYLYDKKDFKTISIIKDNNFNNIFSPLEQKIILEYEKLDYDPVLQEEYRNFIISNEDILQNSEENYSNRFEILVQLIKKISLSNSIEIQNLRSNLLTQLMNTNDPLYNYQKIEDIFIKNNIPSVGKSFLCFNILHPNLNSYNFGDKASGAYVRSPSLCAQKNRGREITIFSDLIKNALGTNNREMLNYINNLEIGNKLYYDIKNNRKIYSQLTFKEINTLNEFRNHLKVLYSNTKNGKYITSSDDVIADIDKLASYYPDASKNSNTLADKIVSSFCHFAGFDTIEAIKKYTQERTTIADKNNRKRANELDFTIEKGDFVKGFEITFLESMLQNGINACDYLGAYQKTDATALDTDLSRINNSFTTINETINVKDNEIGSYGDGYIVLKNDPKKIAVTRVKKTTDYNVDDVKNINGRLEAFYTHGEAGNTTAYGIRTGFAASDIDYLILGDAATEYDFNKMKLAIVLNGLYIPIISKKNSKLIFSPNDYDKLRQKMSGLSYYNENKYDISNNLKINNINSIKDNIEGNKQYINNIKSVIINKLNSKLNGIGFNTTTVFTKNLDYNTIQIIDTGSTSRYTNTPYDCDFDLMLRIDREIYNNPEKMNEFRKIIIETFDSSDYSIVNGDIKELKVDINGKNIPLDISFAQKTDKLSYSSEMCVQDRLNTIKEQYPDKYNDVLSNIIYAKSYLKKYEVYKKGIKQGGLGGLGVENWILENGGSFYDASIEFLKNTKKENGEIKSYQEFVKDYEIWDFGQNYYTDKKNNELTNKNSSYLLYDNFIKTNLTEEGYKKMIVALNEYIKNIEYQDTLETVNKR